MTIFGKTTDALAATMTQMIEQARVDCRHDQYAMAHKVADFMSADRRFDFVSDKVKFAREVMDAKTHGRVVDLTERMKSGASGPVGYVARQV